MSRLEPTYTIFESVVSFPSHAPFASKVHTLFSIVTFYQTGWVQDKDGQWYFMDYHTGIMKTGWIKPRDGKWYFLDYHTGAMRTGWIKPRDGKWYFMDYHKGEMLNGWIKPHHWLLIRTTFYNLNFSSKPIHSNTSI